MSAVEISECGCCGLIYGVRGPGGTVAPYESRELAEVAGAAGGVLCVSDDDGQSWAEESR